MDNLVLPEEKEVILQDEQNNIKVVAGPGSGKTTLIIEKAEFYPKATQYIEQMIDIIVKLLDRKIAYKGSDGSIYFSIAKFKDYGKLSHLDLKSLKSPEYQKKLFEENKNAFYRSANAVTKDRKVSTKEELQIYCLNSSKLEIIQGCRTEELKKLSSVDKVKEEIYVYLCLRRADPKRKEDYQLKIDVLVP